MSALNYSDLQNAFNGVLGLTLPAASATPGFVFVTPSTPVSVSLPTLQKIFDSFAQGQSFGFAPADLPSCLEAIGQELGGQLTLSSLTVGLGTPTPGGVPVTVIGIGVGVDLGTQSLSIDHLDITAVQLQLGFVCLDGLLAWNMAFAVTGTWQGIPCTASIGVSDWLLHLELQDTPDALLNAFASNQTCAALLQGLGISLAPPTPSTSATATSTTSTTPALVTLSAWADLTASTRTYQGSLALTDSGTWNDIQLDAIAVSLTYTPGTGCQFAVMAEATLGELTAEAAVSSQGGVQTFTATTWCAGIAISDFLTDVCTPLGITPDSTVVSCLADIELRSVSLTIQDDSPGISLAVDCAGAVALDDTSILVAFSISSGSPWSLQLQLGSSLTLDMAYDTSTSVATFSASGQATISLDEVVRLLRLLALESVADELAGVSLSVNGAALVMAPAQAPATTPHLLFGLDVGVSGSLSSPVLNLVSGGIDDVGVTLVGANAPWSAAELQALSLPPGIAWPSQAPSGPSLYATLNLGGTPAALPLLPSGQQPGSPGASPPASSGSLPPAQPVASASAARWFDVQKQAGPVYVDRIGLALGRTPDGDLLPQVLCDGAFTLGPVTMDLVGFGVALPLDASSSPPGLGTPAVSLAGLDLSYQKPPLSISGGLLHTSGAYVGQAILQTQAVQLGALGEYATDSGGNPSLALFAVLNDPPLGGPVFCFVTGIAAGFGYNSQLLLPTTAAGVADFALLALATPPAPEAQPPDPLVQMQQALAPAAGADWLAVGLLFRSFELVQSTVLLTAAWGQQLQFDILGQSELSVPPASSERLAYAQVDVEASYVPAQGRLQVLGTLTDSSYVLSPDCHLSGGFAYVLRSSGDFVMSFGGYAAGYDYASQGYPALARLQMVWRVDDHTSIQGSEYFAVTPALMMAGGSLQATWSCGIFSAWFTAGVDLLMQWQPFWYEAQFGMSLGVSFSLDFWLFSVHFTFHVGATLAVSGPAFHGSAHIDLDVVSFTVDFGPSASQPAALDWQQFRAMLPGQPSDDATSSRLLSVHVTDGLLQDLSQAQNADGEPDWIVNGTHFCFAMRSGVPVTSASGAGLLPAQLSLAPQAGDSFGINPMGISSAQGALTLSLTAANGGTGSGLVVEPLLTDMAPAHWSGSQGPLDCNAAALPLTGGYRLYATPIAPQAPVTVPVASLLTAAAAVTAVSTRTAPASPFG